MTRIFRYSFPPSAILQLWIEASILFSIIFFSGMLQQKAESPDIVSMVWLATALAMFMTLMIGVFGLYRPDQSRTFSQTATRIVIAFALGFFLISLVAHWLRVA